MINRNRLYKMHQNHNRAIQEIIRQIQQGLMELISNTANL